MMSAHAHFRAVVFAQDWATPGMQRVELRATGRHDTASTSARVDLDAFLAITP